MPSLDPADLERELSDRFGDALPEHPASDVSAALGLADLLEAEGFSFSLRDLRPKSLDESLWKATFVKDGAEYVAEDPDCALAICAAAAAALRGA